MEPSQNPIAKSQILDDQIILVCSNCKKCIPLILLKLKENVITVDLKCRKCKYESDMKIEEYLNLMKEKSQFAGFCNLKEEHASIQSVKYCLNCKKNVCQTCFSYHQLYPALSDHILLSRELLLDFNCSIHNDKKFKYFCKTCNISICKKCHENTHIDHFTVNAHTIEKEIENIQIKAAKFIEETKEANKNNKDTLINMIDLEIQQLNQMKNELQFVYEDNEKKNKVIQSFFLLAISNYNAFKDIPSYELMMNIKNNLIINKEEVQLKFNQLKNQCMNLIHYYRTHFIVNVIREYQCISTIQGHSDKVNCMIQINNGKLVSGSTDKTIKVWNLDQISCEITLQGHKAQINSLCQLKDGRLISGSSDKTIKLWDISNWTCLSELTDHNEAITSLLPLNDMYFISGSDDQSLKVWEITTLKCIKTLQGHTDSITEIISIEDRIIASSSKDTSIKIWNISEGNIISSLNEHKDEVICLCLLRDKKLVSGSKDKSILIWNIKEMTLIGRLEGNKSVMSLIQLKNGILISGEDKEIKLWDIKAMKQIKTLIQHTDIIKSLIEMNNGTVASCSNDKTISIWMI